MREKNGSVVYFLAYMAGRLVKIGRSKNLRQRLKEIRFHSPVPLRLLGVIRSGFTEEQVHRLFAAVRKRGEWFRLTDDLKAFIEEHRHKRRPRKGDQFHHGLIASSLPYAAEFYGIDPAVLESSVPTFKVGHEQFVLKAEVEQFLATT